MPLLTDMVFALSASVLAGLLAHALCILAIRGGFGLDPVSERSNHKVPVPRLGGVAILAGLACASALLFYAGLMPVKVIFLLVLSISVGLLGVLDDLLTLPAMVKLAVLAALALAGGVLLGPVESLPLPFAGWTEIPWFLGVPLAAFWLLGVVNVINFMDGLNGLIGSFAVLALAGATIVAPGAAPLLLTAQGAVLGFLFCNAFSGRIFLGDAGSLSLAYLVGAAPLLEQEAGVSFWFAPLILLPLIADVALTLVRRASKGARLTEPHKEHIYQRLKSYGWSHQAVALSIFSSGAMALFIATSFMPRCMNNPALYWLTALFIALFWGALMAAMLALKTRRVGLEGSLR